MLKINFDPSLINKKFHFLLDPAYDRPMTLMRGGSSSGKTFSISQVVPMWIMQGHNILIARESGNTLRRSIFSEICKAIRRQKLQKYFIIRVSTLTIQSRVSNGCAMFVATSDEEKLLSITPMTDATAFDMCIQEEASEISFDSQQQLILRMRGETNFNMKRTFKLFNPISSKHHLYKTYFAHLKNPNTTGYIDENIHLHHSTYIDNPHLDQAEINALIQMEFVSPRHYEVYALGRWGTMEKTVYSNWESREIDFADIRHLPISIGVDWGHVHPMAVVFVAYDAFLSTIYIFDEIHLVGGSLENLMDEIDMRMKKYGLNNTKMFCDWSEPRSIELMKESGYNATEAWKPAGSVLSGISFCQTKTIIADRKKCFNTISELGSYSWRSENGVPVDDVIKENDDHMDAMRYALSNHIEGAKHAQFFRSKIL